MPKENQYEKNNTNEVTEYVQHERSRPYLKGNLLAYLENAERMYRRFYEKLKEPFDDPEIKDVIKDKNFVYDTLDAVMKIYQSEL